MRNGVRRVEVASSPSPRPTPCDVTISSSAASSRFLKASMTTFTTVRGSAWRPRGLSSDGRRKRLQTGPAARPREVAGRGGFGPRRRPGGRRARRLGRAAGPARGLAAARRLGMGACGGPNATGNAAATAAMASGRGAGKPRRALAGLHVPARRVDGLAGREVPLGVLASRSLQGGLLLLRGKRGGACVWGENLSGRLPGTSSTHTPQRAARPTGRHRARGNGDGEPSGGPSGTPRAESAPW